jgi:hypothetical protein
MFNPTKLLYVIVALSLVGAASGFQGYRLGYGAAQDEAREALLTAERENAEKQKLLVRSIDKIAGETDAEIVENERRLANADRSLERLREAIRDANARADAAGTSSADAATAAASLGECAGRYRELGRQHDQIRAQLLGLQAYARSVAGNTSP